MWTYIIRDPKGGPYRANVTYTAENALIVRVAGRDVPEDALSRLDALTNFSLATDAMRRARLDTKPVGARGQIPALECVMASRFQFGPCTIVCARNRISPVHAGGTGRDNRTHSVTVEVYDPRNQETLALISVSGCMLASGDVTNIRLTLRDPKGWVTNAMFAQASA